MLTKSAEKQTVSAVRDALKASEVKYRPENIWLSEMYDRFRRQNSLPSKGDADMLLYERTFGKKADSPSDGQKIRYWRTGHFYPRSRKVCAAFGKALSLDEKEMEYLLRSWFDRSDRVFTAKDRNDPVYRERLALMEQLRKEFLMKIRPEDRERFFIPGFLPESNLRHTYCLISQSYLFEPHEYVRVTVHSDSASYANRFSLDMKLLGEISRATMIRHIFLFCSPYVSCEVISRNLEALGYCPLDREHRSLKGLARDRLFMDLLDLYEEACGDLPPEVCMEILKEIMKKADMVLQEERSENLSYLRYKFLSK